MTIEARIAAYLDGELDDRAADKVEAALVDPAVAQLLSEELMLRELLASMPPEAPPDTLIAALENSLGVADDVTDRIKGRLRALMGSGWAAQVPALGQKALAAARVSIAGVRVASSGVSTVRSSLEFAADMPIPRLLPKKPKPLWRRATAYLWGRRK